MDHRRTAPAAGAIVCLLVAVLVAIPYAALTGRPAQGLATYYAVGLVSPPIVGGLGLIGAIVFAAGREERSDPSLVAGVMLVVGVVMALGTLQWAFGPAPGIAGGLGEVAWLETHRLLLVLASIPVPACAGWYARALGVF